MIQSLVVAFGHKARQGKDEAVAAILAARSGQYNIKKYSFAQELKREVTKNALASGGMLALFSDGLRGPDAGFMQENGNILALPSWVQPDPNPDFSDPDCPLGKHRELLQFWGQEYRRSINENYWIEKVEAQIEEDKSEIALLSDLRYFNEFQWALKYGEVVKVVRPGVLSLNTHSSETDLENIPDSQWSEVIYNEGTLEQLKQQSVYVFDEIMEKEK